VVTARWPRAQQRGGAASPRAPVDKVSQKRWCEHQGPQLEHTPSEVAASRAHPSSGSMCGARSGGGMAMSNGGGGTPVMGGTDGGFL
jgi:hypothetical protein